MSQDDFLLSTIQRLSAVGIPYMITGSYASGYYGESRPTADIDIVIGASSSQVDAFLRLLDEHEYASREAALAAVKAESMFNVIDTTSGWKVDLIIRKSRPFSVEEFSRRTTADFMGVQVSILSKEDAILSKLVWSKKGESERQLRDAESVALIQWRDLDLEYLRKWAGELSVEDELNALIERVEEAREELGE